MARFYIATGVSNWKNHNAVRDVLVEHGHEITYDWTVNVNEGSLRGQPIDRIREVAYGEADGIRDADFMVVLLPGGFGTHAEIGMGFILQKPTFIHAFDPKFFSNDEETGKTRNFYWSRTFHHDTRQTLLGVGHAVVEWTERLEDNTYLDQTIPPHLQHLSELPACEDCPIGGRYNFDEGGDQGDKCPRSDLCDWECRAQVEAMNQ
jgi:hypothetical protein